MRIIGIRPLLGQALTILFGKTFRHDPARKAEKLTWTNYISGLDRTSIRQFGRAIFDRDDITSELKELGNPPPTLIMIGESDMATPPKQSEAMQQAIRGATLVKIAESGHTSPIEQPQFVTKAMIEFLST